MRWRQSWTDTAGVRHVSIFDSEITGAVAEFDELPINDRQLAEEGLEDRNRLLRQEDEA